MKRFIILILITVLGVLLASCNSLTVQPCNPIITMSTTVNVTFYNVENYEKHYNEIKKIYQDVDRISSYYNSSEENCLKTLNTNRSIEADDLFYDLIYNAYNSTKDINSYFNIFMGSLNDMWKKAIKEKTILNSQIIINELDKIKNTDLIFDDKTITIVGEGNVDLGGLAKGYATQLAKEYLDDEGINSYLINAGESNVVFGNKNEQLFKIGLTKPYSSGYIGIIEGVDMSIGTSSGKYQNAIIDGVRYHHIINPLTGYPTNNFDNVNVIGDDSLLCDIYSTALFNMSLDEAIDFSNENNIKIILYKDDEIIYKSEGINI